jgi:hypothetical protein
MYIERKDGDSVGAARIGRVSFSKSRKSLIYRGQEFGRLKGTGIKANYRSGGEDYWISGCKKNGEDPLFPAVVHIDEDVREEYWCTIRNMPEKKAQRTFKSLGKYSK